MIDVESEIVNKSIEDVEENQTVRKSEENEQIGDDSDETINNVTANVETDEETRLIIAQLNEILAGVRNIDGISF